MANDFVLYAEDDNFDVEYNKDKGIYRVSYFKDGHFVAETLFDAIELTPHGRWTQGYIQSVEDDSLTPFDYDCSNCGMASDEKYNYCPWCGAKMDEACK